uniref:Anaphase-promoting complex subunit 11 n=1 Tax=Steinernema glaseri TaxID=37863 RepID=A0A1I7YDP4_9BILA
MSDSQDPSDNVSDLLSDEVSDLLSDEVSDLLSDPRSDSRSDPRPDPLDFSELEAEFGPLRLSPLPSDVIVDPAAEPFTDEDEAALLRQERIATRITYPPVDRALFSTHPDDSFDSDEASTSQRDPPVPEVWPERFVPWPLPRRSAVTNVTPVWNAKARKKAEQVRHRMRKPVLSDPPTAFELPTNTAMKIKIKRFVGFAEWKWVKTSTDDKCGICLQVFEAGCVECKMPGEGCPVVEGTCTHSFHVHCINRWIRSHEDESATTGKTCPLCRQDWIPKYGAGAPEPRNMM